MIRFSALGDVAMTVPVIRVLLQQYPDLHISFLSDPFMEPLFRGIDRLDFHGANTKQDYKGLGGLYRLTRKLRKEIPFDAVADLHDVLRSKIIRALLPGPTASIDKGRKEKRELTQPHHKLLRPLKSTFQRYADVFAELGLPIQLPTSLITPALVPNTIRKIGIAPFARHAPKMYPLEQMKEVVRILSEKEGVQVLLFGSKAESESLKEWEHISPRVHSLAGTMSFEEELKMIRQLDVMLSMDSANMHLASLFGVPVVSIWGGTHPFLGFYGWAQPLENAVQLDLPCRPSSVFGNKDCPVHGSAGCMTGITPTMIVKAIDKV